MPQDIATPVTRNVDLGHGNFLIEFEAPPEVLEMDPAQFFMIGIPGSDVLLRRPFSVCGLPGTFDDAGGRIHRGLEGQQLTRLRPQVQRRLGPPMRVQQRHRLPRGLQLFDELWCVRQHGLVVPPPPHALEL